ncbi:hypothetical protein [Tautonia rosea]|uniref:hypothetical protein n=1 Tax=Tautonia rosea TaxID=2728037 RepID=UPI0014746A1C|nr:hypothetical protein [Tautonia rosea]
MRRKWLLSFVVVFGAPLMAQAQTRTYWVHDAGYFRANVADRWVERITVNDETIEYNFRLMFRGEEAVLLYDESRDCFVRLTDDSAYVKNVGDGYQDFIRFYGGRWSRPPGGEDPADEAPRVVETNHREAVPARIETLPAISGRFTGRIDTVVHLTGDFDTYLAFYHYEGGFVDVEIVDEASGRVVGKCAHGIGTRSLGEQRSTVVHLWDAGQGRSGAYRIRGTGSGMFFVNYSHDPEAH